MTPRRVVGLGLCVLDHLYVVDDGALSATRTRYDDRLVCPGGMMGGAIAQAAALGCSTELLSVVGDDEDGEFLVGELAALGVGTAGVLRSADFPTSVSVVFVDRRTGERRFVLPDRRALEEAAPAFDLSAIDRDALLLIDGHFPLQARRAVERARERGSRVIADFNRPRPDWMELLPQVDFPIVPREFVEAWDVASPEAALERLHERCGGTPIVTLGEEGALVLLEGEILHIPAPPVEVVDTTGAGDAFHGGFAAGLCRGLGVLDALSLAAEVGAACCTRLGGSGGLGAGAVRP